MFFYFLALTLIIKSGCLALCILHKNIEDLHNKNMWIGFKKFWTRMFDYLGTTSRREFWWGVFGNAVIMLTLLALLIASFFAYATPINPFSITMIVLFSAFCVVELLPSITLIIRRMHDIGKSGFYIFVLFIPIVGLIWYLLLVTQPSAEKPYIK